MSAFDPALAQLRGWPATHAAAAVIRPSGVIATYGDTALPFALASVTKPLTALATLIAVDEGALELSDAADPELLPGATIAHLMAHASGLAPERLWRAFAPAMRRVYSNVGMEMLADRVEAAVAMPFATYLREAIVLPLNLTATTLHGSAAKDARSSVADLAQVVSQLLHPNGLLDRQTITNATTVHYPGLRGVLPGYGSQDPNDWGLGFEVRSNKHPHWTGSKNSAATYGHFGQSGTMFWIDPVANLGLVALADEPFGPWAIAAWPTLSDAVLAAALEA